VTTTTLSVPAIHCDHCKSSIEGAVGGLEGVSTAEVSVEEKTVTVAYDDGTVGLDVIKETIEEQGFEVA
jgi:copper chaperone